MKILTVEFINTFPFLEVKLTLDSHGFCRAKTQKHRIKNKFLWGRATYIAAIRISSFYVNATKSQNKEIVVLKATPYKLVIFIYFD